MSEQRRAPSAERRGARRPEGGFMLLEVVVAIALLGAILATSMELLGIGLRTVKTSGDYTQAVLLARWKLDEISLQGPRAGATQGDFGGGYRWTAEVAQQGEEEPGIQVRLFKLRVKVSWLGKGGDKGVELVTLRGVTEETPSPASLGDASGRSAAQTGAARRPAARGGASRGAERGAAR